MAIPAFATLLLPILVSTQVELWQTAPTPWYMAAQINQESRWNPKAELKTSRENGIGLGQFTRAYNADGTIRFDKINELRRAHPELKGWSWNNRFDIRYQLKAVVLMDRTGYTRFSRLADSPINIWSFTLSGYNGGDGGVQQDILLCGNTKGCNPRVWKDNVENTSRKSRAKWHGYGQSAFDINRGYVKKIIADSVNYQFAWKQ